MASDLLCDEQTAFCQIHGRVIPLFVKEIVTGIKRCVFFQSIKSSVHVEAR